jgi:hypothetical protein
MAAVNKQSHLTNLNRKLTMKRTSSAVWHGSATEGKGSLTTQSGAFS